MTRIRYDTCCALKGIALLGAGLLWPAAAHPGQDPPVTTDPSFGPVLERHVLSAAVLDRNPGIAAARQAWIAARERVVQRRSLDDPTASYAAAPLSVGASDAPYGDQIRIGQRIPYPGSLRLAGEIAAAEAAAAEHDVEEIRLRLATMASLLFDDYYLVARALEINAEHLRLLEDVQRVSASRYAAGLAPQQAPIQAEVETGHLLHRHVVLETDRRTIAAQINALLHRDPRASLPGPPDELDLPTAPEGAHEVLTAELLAARPEIRALRAKVEARHAAVGLKQLDFYPDFELMTSYNSMWGMPEHRWMVGVGVNLPIRRERVRAGVAEAEAELGAAESELVRLEDEVRADLEVAVQELQKALHVERLYRNRVLPAARDQITAARAGFETGAGSMLSLIDAERSLRSAELNYHQAVADANSRRAELDRALGRIPFGEADAAPSPRSAPQETETNR